MKVVANRDKPFNPRGQLGPTYSAYITFSTEIEAALAILAVDQFEYKKCILKASYGTTKYAVLLLTKILWVLSEAKEVFQSCMSIPARRSPSFPDHP